MPEIKISNVSVNLSIAEFAVLCDCNPSIYNKLPRDVQLVLAEMSANRLADSESAMAKLAAKAIETFSLPKSSGGLMPGDEQFGYAGNLPE